MFVKWIGSSICGLPVSNPDYPKVMDLSNDCLSILPGGKTCLSKLSICAFQGIKAVLAESYERIHRSNLVGMGVIPLQYLPGEDAESLGLTGRERYTILIPDKIVPRMNVQVKVSRDSATTDISVLDKAVNW